LKSGGGFLSSSCHKTFSSRVGIFGKAANLAVMVLSLTGVFSVVLTGQDTRSGRAASPVE
jgi:hypothetical protein